jgi:hypothetical protein
MATTTNYGWTTPDDTALVKDGASAIRTLGTAIDTTVFNNASAGIAKTIVDAKGDIIAATAADTVSRLAVGSNDQVLTADSSTATGLKWAAPSAGGMTSIASGSLSGTSVTISSIPATYNNLVIIIRDFYTLNTASGLRIRLNGNSTSGTYGAGYISMGSTSVTNFATTQTFIFTPLDRTSDQNTFAYFEIFDYANSMNKKGMFYTQTELTNDNRNAMGHFFAKITSAINSVTITNEDPDTFGGGTYQIYGVK